MEGEIHLLQGSCGSSSISRQIWHLMGREAEQAQELCWNCGNAALLSLAHSDKLLQNESPQTLQCEASPAELEQLWPLGQEGGRISCVLEQPSLSPLRTGTAPAPGLWRPPQSSQPGLPQLLSVPLHLPESELRLPCPGSQWFEMRFSPQQGESEIQLISRWDGLALTSWD